jgi:lysophospholipase L1-like esterase/Ca2+-binding EF-hand superfamily protein
VARQAATLFRLLDQNGDGLLDNDELPTALRAERSKWDLDEDGTISQEEFLDYFKTRVKQYLIAAGDARSMRLVPSASSQQPLAGGTQTTSADLLPVWFLEMDIDSDGQVGLDEWWVAGQSLEVFRRLDLNGDGFLTASEVLSKSADSTTPSLSSEANLQKSDTSPSREGKNDRLTGGSVTLARGGSNSRPMSAASLLLDSPPLQVKSAQRPAPRTRADQLEARHLAMTLTPRRVIAAALKKASAPKPAPSAAASPPPLPELSGLDELAITPLPLNDPANSFWAERDYENDLQLLMGGHANVVFLGDSITDFLRIGAGKPLWDAYFAPLNAVNFAIGGITTSQVLWQVETGQVAYATPDVVVLLIGSNNLGWGESPEATAAGIAKIVYELRAQLPQTQILLLGLLPRGQSPFDPFRAEIAQVNRLIAELEGDGVTFLDFGDAFLRRNGTISPLIMPDYLHPSQLGYQIYTIYTWQAIVALLVGG